MGECDLDPEPVDGLSPTRNDEMDDELRALVKPELEVGERMLWASRASLHRPSSFSDLGNRLAWAAAFGIVCIACLSAFFGSFRPGVDHLKGPFFWLGSLSGFICFVIITFCISYWFSDRTEFAKMANQCYALTDRRAIIWRRDPRTGGVEVFQFTPDKIRDVHRVEFPDGHGDVVFRLPQNAIYGQHPGAFQGVADVRLVEGMVRRVLLRRHSGKAERRAKMSQ